MFGGRHTVSQSTAVRKSRMENTHKPSMLPKPRRPGSSDRASVEARRPSNSYRSSSADPPRATFAGGRLSREASASKIPLNRRSRSQQDKYGQSSVTPLRSSQYSRTTTTPVRTPDGERHSRTWQASLDRALAFVTVKDQRPLTAMSWQRAELARVSERMMARAGVEGGGGQPQLTRPLTITRFVEVCGDLLSAIMRDIRLNNDNYVTKLPNLAKRFLYPGVLSKSWLKTVNTLHAYPQALAFIGYFLDLVNHIETPVSDEWLYADKDEYACLKRDYLYKSWIRFQEQDPQFDDLDAEYMQSLKQLMGFNEEKVQQLQHTIEECRAALEDESELAARAEEERLRARRDAAALRVRALRAERRAVRAQADEQRARAEDTAQVARSLDADINHITSEIQQLKRELETQDISVAERARLLDEVDYATRVIDSKRTLAEQVSKIMQSKETELAVWQKKTLDACVEYKQALIHLAARFPPLAALHVDEQELMESRCAEAVSRAVDTLRAHAADLTERRNQHSRARAHHTRQTELQLEETRAKIAELKSTIARLQRAVEAESGREASEAAAWARDREALARAVEELRASEELETCALSDLQFWEKQEAGWVSRLTEMREYICSLRDQLRRELDAVKKERANRVLEYVAAWNHQLDLCEAEESAS